MTTSGLEEYHDCHTDCETKNIVQRLEEKIEGLIQREIIMTKQLYEMNSKLQQLESIHKTSVISFHVNSSTRFINLNCSNLKIVFINVWILYFDDVEIPSSSYMMNPQHGEPLSSKHGFDNINQVINSLKNIITIDFQLRFPLSYVPIGYLDIIKKIIEINKKVTIHVDLCSNVAPGTFRYMFENLQVKHVVEIKIRNHYSVDTFTEFLEKLDETIKKKIIYKSYHDRSHMNIGY